MKKIVPPEGETFARIRVIGIGGSGKNVTNYMVKAGIPGVEFVAANTDAQDLRHSKSEKKIHLGKRITKGLGTGMNPVLGRSAAEESLGEITEMLKGSDLVFIACGMGGGTGTGAAPVIAKAAMDLGILTVAVVTKPFTFEGGKRKELAEDGLIELSQSTDAIVVIPNDNILSITDDKTTMADAFFLSDEVLQKAVSGISQLIMKPGDINIDFADIRVILEKSGISLLGLGTGRGTNRAELAVTRAISSPLLDTSIKGSRRALFSIASKSRSDIAMREVQIIAERIAESVDEDAKIIFGTSTDKDLRQGEIRITLIATAFEDKQEEKQESKQEQKKEVSEKEPTKEQSVPATTLHTPYLQAERLSDYTPQQTEDDIILSDEDLLYSDKESEDDEDTGWKMKWPWNNKAQD